MYKLPDQIQQQQPPRPNAGRIPPTQPRQQQPPPQNRNQYGQPQLDRTQDHTPLVFSIYNLFKKLLKHAKENQNEQSDQFQNQLSSWVRDTIQQHPQFKRNNQQQNSNSIIQSQYFINLFISVIFFNDITYVRPLLSSLKRITEILIEYLKQKDKGDQYLDNMRKIYDVSQSILTNLTKLNYCKSSTKRLNSMMREQVLNKYLAIYYRKKYWQKLYNSSIKQFTSEYLPSIVIYNLCYIPIQDQPQQSLRECIIPSAAIELMGTAANVSSRLLKPLFNQIIANDIKTITQITDYVTQQSISYGTQQTISNFLIQQILFQISNIHDVLENQQTQFNFNSLIMCLKYNYYYQVFLIKFKQINIIYNHLQNNLLPLAQYLLEYIYQYLNEEDAIYDSQLNEDILIQLQGVYQEQWNKQCLLGCKALTATQPWVKQLILIMRKPAQSYQLILNNQETFDQFWLYYKINQILYLYLVQQNNKKLMKLKVFRKNMINKSLQQLNQWNTLKQVDLSKVQAIQNKITIGFRERQRDTTDQGWKEFNLLQEVKQTYYKMIIIIIIKHISNNQILLEMKLYQINMEESVIMFYNQLNKIQNTLKLSIVIISLKHFQNQHNHKIK